MAQSQNYWYTQRRFKKEHPCYELVYYCIQTPGLFKNVVSKVFQMYLLKTVLEAQTSFLAAVFSYSTCFLVGKKNEYRESTFVTNRKACYPSLQCSFVFLSFDYNSTRPNDPLERHLLVNSYWAGQIMLFKHNLILLTRIALISQRQERGERFLHAKLEDICSTLDLACYLKAMQ